MAYVHVESEAGEQRVALDRERLTIGRSPANDIVIPQQQISRYHAELRADADGWWIADLDSTNGVQVRGRRVERHRMRPGERVLLAPGVSVVLSVDNPAHDVSVQPTAYVPALARGQHGADSVSTLGLGGAAAPAWLPPSSATAWGASGPGESRPREPGETAPIEGDLFRRKRARVSGRPASEAPPDPHGRVYGLAAAHLHLCQTCGQQTAPDGQRCQACGSSIAVECRSCRLALLPIQDACPRCQTPNPSSVLRAQTASKLA